MARCSLDQLTALVAVSEHGSFSQAARAVGKDRATLHHQIGDLEIDWGITLFDRSGRSPKLTDEGKNLVRQSQHILYQISAMELSCDNAFDGVESELTIYHDASVAADTIAKVTLAVQQAFPLVRLHWLQGSRPQALAAFENGTIDFAITMHGGKVLPNKGVKFRNLGFPRFSFYAHTNSALAKKKSVSMADLETERQYVFENFLDAELGKTLLISLLENRVSNVDVLMALLKNGGYAVLPNYLAESAQYKNDYKKLSIDFMLQSGRLGYVLLYKSQVKNSDVFQLVIDEVSLCFEDKRPG